MAEDKKKKPRKQRKDKGKKRKPRIKNPQLQTGSIAFKHIGTNLTQLVGLMSRPYMPNAPPYPEGQQGLVTIQKELTELSKAFKKDVEDRFQAQQGTKKLTEGEIGEAEPDVAQAQEENAQELDRDTAALRLQRAAMASQIRRERREKEEAKADLAQFKEINDKMFQEIEKKKQIADELTRSIYEKEYYAQQYQKKARYEEIMRTTGSSKDIKKYYGIDLEPYELHDFRIQLLEEEEIPYQLPERGLRGAPRKPIFAGELPEGTGGSYVTDLQAQVSQLEMERGQMEDQIGGLHDTVRELKMMNEDAYAGHLVSDAIFGAINDLTTEGYERKIQEEQIAQQQEYQGLAGELERERLSGQERRMGLEAEIRSLGEQRDAEAERARRLESEFQARIKELEEGKLTKKEFRRLEKEYQDQLELYKQALSEEMISNEDELQKRMDLYKESLAEEMINQAEAYVEQRTAFESEIEQLSRENEELRKRRPSALVSEIETQTEAPPTRGEMVTQTEPPPMRGEMETQTEKERRPMRRQFGIQTEAQERVEMVTQTEPSPMRGEMETQTEQERRPVRRQFGTQTVPELPARRGMAMETQTEPPPMRGEMETQTEKEKRPMRRQFGIQTEAPPTRGEMVTQTEPLPMRGEMATQTDLQNVVVSELRQVPSAPLAPLAPLQIPSLIPVNPVPPQERVSSPTSRIMAGSSSPKIIESRRLPNEPSVRPQLQPQDEGIASGGGGVQSRRELRRQQQEDKAKEQGFQRRMAAEQPIPVPPRLMRSISEETSESQQEANKRRTQNLAAELGARLPPEPVMSSRAIGLASARGRDTWSRRGEDPTITSELVGEKTTALLKTRVGTVKSGGQRVPLTLQPRSMDIDEELARMPVADLQRGQEETNILQEPETESTSLDFTSKEARLAFNPQFDAYKLMPAGPEKEAEKARLKALRKSLKESAKVSL